MSPQNQFVIVGDPVTISIGERGKIPRSIDPLPCDPYRIAPTYAHILGYYWRGAAGIIVLAESHESVVVSLEHLELYSLTPRHLLMILLGSGLCNSRTARKSVTANNNPSRNKIFFFP